MDEQHSTDISRRSTLKRIGAGTAVVWAAPAVLSMGSSAAAASPPPGCPNFQDGCVNNGNCNDSATCFCYQTPEGINTCGENHGCNQPCTTSAECGAGFICAVDTCCDSGNCAPICGTQAGFADGLQGATATPQ